MDNIIVEEENIFSEPDKLQLIQRYQKLINMKIMIFKS